ncbi:beta-galactosidase 5 [Senna tora]|uniref:beta-galactosidase n=1 Tax=Senna tora TaxID=362788 RepID=A0A834XDX5_9FABA|nr:beta-galactosidase 5 [Senna tora]
MRGLCCKCHKIQNHGGTNFGRSAGGPFITTSYEYDAPIDEYVHLYLGIYAHLYGKLKMKASLLYRSHCYFIRNVSAGSCIQFRNQNMCTAFLANYHSKSTARE